MISDLLDQTLRNILCNFPSTHHQQALVSVDDAQPNGHMGVLTVLQKGTDGDVPTLGVRLLTRQKETGGEN